jgi:hypothetical protein
MQAGFLSSFGPWATFGALNVAMSGHQAVTYWSHPFSFASAWIAIGLFRFQWDLWEVADLHSLVWHHGWLHTWLAGQNVDLHVEWRLLHLFLNGDRWRPVTGQRQIKFASLLLELGAESGHVFATQILWFFALVVVGSSCWSFEQNNRRIRIVYALIMTQAWLADPHCSLMAFAYKRKWSRRSSLEQWDYISPYSQTNGSFYTPSPLFQSSSCWFNTLKLKLSRG